MALPLGIEPSSKVLQTSAMTTSAKVGFLLIKNNYTLLLIRNQVRNCGQQVLSRVIHFLFLLSIRFRIASLRVFIEQ